MSFHKSEIRRYASVRDFVDQVRGDKRFAGGSDRWAGGTFEDAIRYAVEGDLSKVPAAEEIVDKLDSEIDADGVRPVWTPAVVGAIPLVPAFLAGTPEAMLAKTDVPDARGDLEIWANTTVSCGCSAEDMMRRGVVTLAFAMALSRVRNVRLVIYSTAEKVSVAIPLSYPLDFSEVCAMFCQPSVTRQLIYSVARKAKNGKGGLGWSEWCEINRGREGERRALIEKGGMPEDAIVLGTEKLGEFAGISDEELVKVLNDKVREYCGGRE